MKKRPGGIRTDESIPTHDKNALQRSIHVRPELTAGECLDVGGRQEKVT
jgi:hypothetical protein